MASFTFTVIETRQYECTYTVEADTPEQARDLAARGETTDETTERCIGVTDRYLD